MKRVSYLLIILLLSIVLVPIVFAKDTVKIESYKLVKQSEFTTELSNPKIDGLNISFDLSFGRVKDYATYQIVVDNSTDKDYEISKDTDFKTSKYISYSYDFENNNNIVKANSKLTMYITITYSKEVPASELKNGQYTENNKVTISLINDPVENPDSAIDISIKSLIILIIIGLLITIYLVTKKKAYLNILLLIILIPTIINAAEKLYITVTTKITIAEKYSVTYEARAAVKYSERDKCLPEFRASREAAPGYKIIIDGEEYKECQISIKKTIHSAGETINVESIKTTIIIMEKYNPETDKDENICTFDENNNTYTCPKEVLTDSSNEEMSYWGYQKTSTSDFELDDMNIERIINQTWKDDGYIKFDTPNKFTMPAHDVTIYAYPMNK
jgi:hypothetical protein